MNNVKADHIIVPDGVEYLAEKAFQSTRYKTVTLPDSVRYIGDECFASCTSLESIVCPKEVDYYGTDVFKSCTSLSAAALPENLTEIPDNTFRSCALTDIPIPSGVKRIGAGAFAGCAGLTSIAIPEGVEIIEGGLSGFYMGSPTVEYGSGGQIINIDFSRALWTSDGAFGDCTALTSVQLPSTLRVLGGSAFYMTPITSIDLKNVSYLGAQCFEYSQLKSLRIPDTVHSLRLDAYGKGICEYCYMLEDIVLPTALTYVNLEMFRGCTGLKTITVPSGLICAEGNLSSTEENDLVRTDWYKSLPDGPIYFGNCLVGYKGDMPENYTLTVRDGTTSVTGFRGQTNLAAVKLPDSIQFIADVAFYGCKNLKTVDMSSAVWIGEAAFCDCSLTSFRLPANCQYVSGVNTYYFPFWDVPLTKDGLNEGLRYIGENIFLSDDVTVPASVRTIGAVTSEQGKPVYKWKTSPMSISYEPNVFASTWYDNEDSQTMENHTIRGYTGSMAQFYAEKGGFNFVSIGEIPKIKGDINMDGYFNVSDVVLLQKWLLAVPNVHLADWEAGNFCDDDRLDVFDLCLMKRALINGTNE